MFVDIDGDGDLDLFVGKSDGIPRFFANTGTNSSPAWASTATKTYGLDNIGTFAAPTFVDIDRDGDLDAMIGNAAGSTIYYRNTGTASAPAFLKQIGAFGLGSVGSFAAPAFADIDGDGDLDALIGGGDGSLRFFRNVATAGASVPVYVSEAGTFGLSNVGLRADPTFVDYDHDGLVDVVTGNAAGRLAFFRNNGTASLPTYSLATTVFGATNVAAQAAPAFADIDLDGDPDLFIGSQDGSIAFQLNGQPTPVTVTPNRGRLMVTEGGASDAFTIVLQVKPTSAVTFSLISDHLVTSPNPTLVFTSTNWNIPQIVLVSAVNDSIFQGTHPGRLQYTVTSLDPIYGGTAPTPILATITDNDLLRGEPAFQAGIGNRFGIGNVGYLAHPTFVDIDGDGDMDLFVGNYAGNTVFLANTGSVSVPAFTQRAGNFGLPNVGNGAAPAFVDIDGDGDMDAFIGNLDGQVSFFRNVGSGSMPTFASASGNFGLTLPQGYGSATPTFADIDADGRPDAFVGSSKGDIFYFRNVGTATAPVFASPVANPSGLTRASGTSSVALGDLDGDGDFDLVVSDLFGGVDVFRNMGSASAPSFVAETGNFGLATVGAHTAPTLVDINGDGDLDAFIGNNYGDTFSFENIRSTNSKPVIRFLQPINYTDTPVLDNFLPVLGTVKADDANLDTVTYGILGGTDNGTTVSFASDFGVLTVNKTSGSYTFVPDNLAMESLGSTAVDDFVITASDGKSIGSRLITLNIVQSGNTETPGNDLLVATAGNETLIPLGGVDTIDGAAGIDTVSFVYALGPVKASLAITAAQNTGNGDTLSLSNVENLTGSPFNDVLTGDAGNNVLNGGTGQDTLTGGAGSDTYYVDSSVDLVQEALNGGTADRVISMLTAYTLPANVEYGVIGNQLGASLTGNSLSNLLISGPGADQLTGGASSDRFVFNNLSDSGITAGTADTLLDFSQSGSGFFGLTLGDFIDLSSLDANELLGGDQAFTNVTSSATTFSPTMTFATGPGALYFDQTARVLYGNTDSDAAPEFSIKVLGTVSLGLGDFIA